MSDSPAKEDEEVFARLREALARVLIIPAERIGRDSGMSNLKEWDSLRFLLVVFEVERAFGLRFAPASVPGLRSVDAMLAAIAKERGRPS